MRNDLGLEDQQQQEQHPEHMGIHRGLVLFRYFEECNFLRQGTKTSELLTRQKSIFS